ncbi:MAG TPA: hypothetical protein VLO13_10425 [Halomonas sp.]|nr:hypothetical protein [Halomonas sp.]
MVSFEKISTNPVIDASQPIFLWWSEYWLKSSLPMAKAHLAWLENMSQTMQMEAELFQAIADSSERLTQCFVESGCTPTNTDIHDCYQDMMQTLTDAQLQRFEKVAQLPHEFRKRLWEEI